MMDNLATVLTSEGLTAYEKIRDRLNTLAHKANGIGWGYGDHINGVVDELEAELGE